MSMVADDMAFSVAEATMQEWRAAVAQASLGLPPLPAALRSAPAFVPHPMPARPVALRVARRAPAVPPPAETGPVAGARSIYWVGLAAALAWAVLL